MSVIHTFGRDLKWNPHVHLLVTEGCAGDKTPRKQVTYFHYERLRKSWQKLILDAIGRSLQKEKRIFKKLMSRLYSGNEMKKKKKKGKDKRRIKLNEK